MATPDPTITIAGLEAEVRQLHGELHDAAVELRSAADQRLTLAEYSAKRDGRLAGLTAERDALAAQLAEARAALDAAPKVSAIHSYAHGPGPCMTCGAWPPGTRELIAAIMRDLTDDNGDVSTTAVEAAARYALTARGIPVTPEVGK